MIDRFMPPVLALPPALVRGQVAVGPPLNLLLAVVRASPRAQTTGCWRGTHPAVSRSLEEESDACFACLSFPLAHQLRIRTMNGLERLNQERKRRTRVIPGALWADFRTGTPVYDW